MQKLIKNRFIIPLIFFVLIISINSLCFANSDEVNFKKNDVDITLKLPQGYGIDYKYYLVFCFPYFSSSDNTNYIRYNIVTSNSSPIYTRINEKGSYVFFVEEPYLNTFFGITVEAKSKKITLDYSTSSISSSYSVGFSSSDFKNIDSIFYSNHNIYDYDTKELVFQVAPVTVEQVTLEGITQVEEIPQMMGKVLEMIIPIGLIIFGIGLIIFLIRLVILRMR